MQEAAPLLGSSGARTGRARTCPRSCRLGLGGSFSELPAGSGRAPPSSRRWLLWLSMAALVAMAALIVGAGAPQALRRPLRESRLKLSLGNRGVHSVWIPFTCSHSEPALPAGWNDPLLHRCGGVRQRDVHLRWAPEPGCGAVILAGILAYRTLGVGVGEKQFGGSWGFT